MARYGDDPKSKKRVPLKDWVVEKPFDSADYLDGPLPRYEGEPDPNHPVAESDDVAAAVRDYIQETR